MPQLRLCLFDRLVPAARLCHDLAGMHVALGLHARAPRIVFGRGVGDTGRRRAGNLAGAHTARQPLGLLSLQLLQHVLDGDGVEDVFRRRGQDGQHGEGAVLLVLLKAATEAVLQSIAAAELSLVGAAGTYFSLATLSSPILALASPSFPNTYWPARYPAPSTPAPIAKLVRFRRSHCRVD